MYYVVWPFWFMTVSVCGLSFCDRFGLWPFRFLTISVCARLGVWPCLFNYLHCFPCDVTTHKWPHLNSGLVTEHGWVRTAWWRRQMETFSALLALCAGNSPVTLEFPSQRPVARSLDVLFDLCLNKRLSKHSWDWWFETPSCSLWRHRNGDI